MPGEAPFALPDGGFSPRLYRFCSEKSPGAIRILLPEETSSAVSPAGP